MFRLMLKKALRSLERIYGGVLVLIRLSCMRSLTTSLFLSYHSSNAIHMPQAAQCLLQHQAEHATSVDISGQAGNRVAKYQQCLGRTFLGPEDKGESSQGDKQRK